MKEFPFYSSFSSIIKPIVSEEKDKFLALASLERIRAFIPDIDTKANHDLLPVAFNAFVVNRVNKNDDVIDTDTALATVDNFLFKQINAEHNRKHVVGVITNVGFSEFGTDKPLTKEQVKDMKDPFNVTLGGVLWRVVDNNVATIVEESNDPTSDLYMQISASWELGFTGYEILVLEAGQKNVKAGLIISEATEVEKYRPHLKALKGSGVLEDGRRVFRKPSVGVTPLGVAITEAPAADVKGVATKSDGSEAGEVINKLENVDKGLSKSMDTLTQNLNNISQAENSNVNIERHIDMTKITSLKDITDESLKQCNASVISDFISSELKKSSEVWETEKNKLDKIVAQATETEKKQTEEYNKLKKDFETLQATVNTLQAEKAEKEKVEKFNARMTEVAEVYELDDEVRAAIVEEIKSLASDEDFDKWKKKANVLLKAFAKKKLPPQFDKSKKTDDKEEAKDGGKEEKKEKEGESKASTNKENVVDAALDKAKQEKGGLPNSSTANEATLKEKYANAFAKENFIIKL
jgi:hypothetical protein